MPVYAVAHATDIHVSLKRASKFSRDRLGSQIVISDQAYCRPPAKFAGCEVENGMHRLGSIASPLELGVNAPSQFRFKLVQRKLRSAVARHFTCFTILDNEKAKVAQVPMTDERQHPSPGILTLDRTPDEGGGDGVPPESSEGLKIVLAPLAQYQSFSCYSLHDVLLSKVAILPSASAGYHADRRGDRLPMKAAVLPAYWRVKRVLRSGLQRLGNMTVTARRATLSLQSTPQVTVSGELLCKRIRSDT